MSTDQPQTQSSWLKRVRLPHTPTALAQTTDQSLWVGFCKGPMLARFTDDGRFVSAVGVPKIPRALAAAPDDTLSVCCSARVNLWGVRSAQQLVVTLDQAGREVSRAVFANALGQHVVERSGRRYVVETGVFGWAPGQSPQWASYATRWSELVVDQNGAAWLRNGNTIYSLNDAPNLRKTARIAQTTLYANAWLTQERVTAFAPTARGVWTAFVRSAPNQRTIVRKILGQTTPRPTLAWSTETPLSGSELSQLVATKDGGVWAICARDLAVFRISTGGSVIERRSLKYEGTEPSSQQSLLSHFVLSADQQTLYCLDVARCELLLMDVSTIVLNDESR
jgi:hypothetical protein